MRLIDLVGQRFGKRVVLERCGSSKFGPLWRVKCDCGQIDLIDGGNIRNGHADQCHKCANKILIQKGRVAATKHGMTSSRTWTSWHAMTTRCRCSTVKDYPRYGGRGITVCDRWSGDRGFVNFLADMGERPENTSLDRKAVNGNYEPANCRWATRRQQDTNRRKYCAIHHFTDNEFVAEAKRRGFTVAR